MLPQLREWAVRRIVKKTIRLTIPWKDKYIHISIIISNQLMIGLIVFLALVASLQIWLRKDNQNNQQGKIYDKHQLKKIKYNDVLGYAFNQLEQSQSVSTAENEDKRAQFLQIKHTLISQTLIRYKVSRLDQLSDKVLLELNRQLSEAFIEIILKQIKVEPHVMEFFTDTSELKKIETALMEQAKFHVPASIKLAQAALETAYGQRIVHNNYFGIKDKTHKSKVTTTTEYYTQAEYEANKSKVIKKERIIRGGNVLYKCIIKDSFAQYNTPWESFRAHSIFLSENERYSPLFTKGKNYEDWADKIGSTKYGGVGYATSPIYGELLKKIIRRYNLDLLDY